MTSYRLNSKTLMTIFPVICLLLAAWNKPAFDGASRDAPPGIAKISVSRADESNRDELLQFTAGGHILGFRQGEMYIAAADHALKVEFLGAQPSGPSVNSKSPSLLNDLHSAKPLDKVVYANLWDGISLVYERSGSGFVKSTYHVARGANPSRIDQIRLGYNVPVRLDNSGNLLLTFETGQLRESAPIAWQEIDGKRQPVEIGFRILNEREVGFSVGVFDPAFPLVIDPTISWHTFLGSTSGDDGYAIAVDDSGNVYVAGSSLSTWGTPVNAHAGIGYADAFTAKLDSNGARLWHTFMGSATDDEAYGIAVDGSGNVYVAGVSDASWGTAPVNPHAGADDAFAAKLNSTGNLVWNTFMGGGGGTSFDVGSAIAVDDSGNVYVGGSSRVGWGTPVNPFAGGFWDAFAAKLNNNGALVWNTFMGSTSDDRCNTIVVDGTGNVYVAGKSDGTWGTPVNPHAGIGGSDAFAAKLNSSGVRQWHTFMGASGSDSCEGIAVDSSGNVYVAGESPSTWGTPVNPHTGTVGDAFAAQLNSSGALQWNTFMGADGGGINDVDRCNAITVDGSGNVYVAGLSEHTWGTPDNPHSGGGNDAFAVKLNSDGSYLWHTFMGSTHNDYGYGIAVDGSGNILVVGSSDNWGTPINPWAGGDDAFVVKLAQETVPENAVWSYDVGTAHNRLVLPDINGDGFDELLLNEDPEKLRIISGADGSTELWSYTLDTEPLRYRRGLAVINDLDDDGIKDIIAVTGTSGNDYDQNNGDDEMYAVSGAVSPPGNRVLWFGGGPLNLGYGLNNPVVLADTDGDGYDDIFASTLSPVLSPLRGDYGYHISGKDGGIIWNYTYPAESSIWDIYGRTAVPDLDGDGIQDIVVSGAGGSGGVAAWKGGTTKARLWRALDGEWIRNPAAVGDLNGDGKPEIAVAVFNVDPPDLKLKVLNGASGSLVWDFAFGNTASSIENLGDVNSNGFDDIAIGSYFINSKGGTDYKVYVLEGKPDATTRIIWSHDLVDQNSYVKVMDDVDGDGKKDVIVTGGNQKVMILSGVDGTSIFEETFGGATGTAQLGEYNNSPGDEILTSVGNIVYAIEIPSLSDQRAALIDLYNSTNGDSWTENSGWKEPPLAPDGFSEAGECSVDNPWYGITCSGENVVGINLQANNLVGTIPASIGGLTNLQTIYINGNQLTGSIPTEIGSLVDLQRLYLYNNQLSGSIPIELGNLSNLQALYAHTNQFDGTIPPELGNLTNLRFLTLDNNQLTGSIPTELENLLNLQVLQLHYNQLSGSIPPELGNLTNLKYLSLINNQLTGSIPPELGNLSSLQALKLTNNQLSGSIPTELGSLTSLQDLMLDRNQLTGAIPAELGNCANLELIYLQYNLLTGSIPPELGNLTNLQYLYLTDNQLSGSIPTELGNLVNLIRLFSNVNQLTGKIPTEFGNLLNLEYLRLEGNQLTGSIPAELTNLTALIDGRSDFRWNALYTSDTGLQTFLNTKQTGGDWESTQTIAPTNLGAGSPTEDSITLTWTAIPYTADSGGYGVGYSATPGGPYTLFENTADKTVTSSTVTGLTPGTDYYFVLETHTNSHFNNQNTVYSEHSAEVSATTCISAGTHSPDIPTAVSPIHEAVVPVGDVILESSPFNDPDPLDTHASTYWQVKYAGNVYGREDYPASFNFLATSTGLTTHTVTGLVDGMQYEWRILYTDSSGDYSWSDENAFKVGTSEAADVPQVYPGTAVNHFKMMTLPYWFDDPTAASIIGSPYDTAEFRIGYYDPEVGGGTYIEADHPEAIASPGAGFWILARNGLDITAGGIPVTTEMDLEVPLFYNADYANGWNQIGPPNAKNYYWNDVEIIQYDPDDGSVLYGPVPISSLADANPFIDLKIWRWNNGIYESFIPGDLFLLEKYEGYWVKAKQSNLYLVFKVSAQQASTDTKKTITLAQLIQKGRRWLKNLIFASPQAYAGPDDTPPMPMGGLTNSQAGSSGGCFITTTAFGLP